MKQSSEQPQPQQRIQVSLRNRMRLMLQNRKLLAEVYKLEQMISTVIEKTVADEFIHREESEQLQQKYQQDQDEQLRTIARLKREIKAARAGIAEQKFVEIRNEENAVTYLKREMISLASERDTLARKKQEKQAELEFHKPINSQTATTREQYMRTKATNNELKAKIHEVEREVAKYHNLKELAKTSVPKEYDNPAYQSIKMENEIAGMRKEMRRVDQKWRAKIEALDREYFGFREIKNNKLVEIEGLEKQCRNYELHAASVRDEQAVASDRERISGVVISPQKRREMQEMIEEERKRLKRLSPKGTQKTKTEKQTKQTPFKIETGLTPISQSKQEPSQPQQPTQTEPQTLPQTVQPPLPSKMVESVGVGTTFYYADD